MGRDSRGQETSQDLGKDADAETQTDPGQDGEATSSCYEGAETNRHATAHSTKDSGAQSHDTDGAKTASGRSCDCR